MSDRADRFFTELMTAVADATPEPPPWPGEPSDGRQRLPSWRKVAVGMAAFASVLLLVGATALLSRLGGDEVGVIPVSIATPDGTLLSGEIWEGAGRGAVVLAGAYGAADRELDPIARPLAARGVTVLTYDLRGEGGSHGEVDPELLDEDLAAAIDFIGQRVAAPIVVVAYRHSGAAAIAAAGRGELAVDGLVGLYAMGRYLNQDAVALVAEVDVPLLVIGGSPELAELAPDGSIFRSVAPQPAIFTESGGTVAQFIDEFLQSLGG